MAKNKFTQAQIEKIQSMNYNQLGKAVIDGEYTIDELKKAYTQMRDIAVKRSKRLGSEKVTKEFGSQKMYSQDGEYFRKIKYMSSTQELIREIADVSKFLKSKKSTISGLKESRKNLLDSLNRMGFNVSQSDYINLVKFLKWFKSSEFAMKYDSDSPVVAEVFNEEKSNPEQWRKLLEEYSKYEQGTPVRQY